jgi:hypothetical protein
LWAIGIPSPFLWGFLAAILRFIPYVGPWIAATLPIALSLAAFQGWGRPVATVVLFVALELVSNNIVEPWLYGQGTGVSVVGIIAAALFWTWLWGPLGLVLSMPLTVCLTVLGRYAPGLKFVTVLFSDQPALETKLRLYQRLLALDYHEAAGIVDKVLTTEAAPELYATVLMPSLSLAEQDRAKGQLTDGQRQFIYKFILDTVQELAVVPELVRSTEPTSLEVQLPFTESPRTCLCLPAEDEGDEVASVLVAQCLAARGVAVKVLTREGLNKAFEQGLREDSPESVVISAVAPSGAISARGLCRRIRGKFAQLQLVVGLWNANGDLTHTRERLAAAGATSVVTSINEAATLLASMASDKEVQPSY